MSAPTNPLEKYFRANDKRLIHKWMHYFDIYDHHFARFRNRSPVVLEFGVSHGGSLQMWKDYFGPGAMITGVDIDPRCAEFTEEGIDVMIGDQEDRSFLRQVNEQVGTVDVLIEDGGHTMAQQINTFEELWPSIRTGGVFLMEDLHTQLLGQLRRRLPQVRNVHRVRQRADRSAERLAFA